VGVKGKPALEAGTELSCEPTGKAVLSKGGKKKKPGASLSLQPAKKKYTGGRQAALLRRERKKNFPSRQSGQKSKRRSVRG